LHVSVAVVTEVENEGTMPGAVPESEYSATEVPLSPGDLLVLYTDGLPDTRGQTGRLGLDPVREAVAGAVSADAALSAITETIERFEQGPQADDTAIVAIRYEPPSA
jgi:serine phosphatase RsbU (regulator of sigma subunit)